MIEKYKIDVKINVRVECYTNDLRNLKYELYVQRLKMYQNISFNGVLKFL